MEDSGKIIISGEKPNGSKDEQDRITQELPDTIVPGEGFFNRPPSTAHPEVDPEAETLCMMTRQEVDQQIYIPNGKYKNPTEVEANRKPEKIDKKPFTSSTITEAIETPEEPIPPEIQKINLLRKLEKDFLSSPFESESPATVILEIIDYFENSPEFKDSGITFAIKTFGNKFSRGLRRITSGMIEKLTPDARKLGTLSINIPNINIEEVESLEFGVLFNGKSKIEIIAGNKGKNQRQAEKTLQLVKTEMELLLERKNNAERAIEVEKERKKAIEFAKENIVAEINKANFGNRNYSRKEAVEIIRTIQNLYPPKPESDKNHALVNSDNPLGTLDIYVEGHEVKIKFFYNRDHHFYETFSAKDLYTGEIFMEAGK